MSNFKIFKKGLKNGLPIFLGYFAVSFAFGIKALECGILPWQAVLISATNLTSAGQASGIETIATQSGYITMALTQLIINLRYCLMSSSLSQRFDTRMKPIHRYLIAFGVTDEIFGVSSAYEKENIPPAYCYGLIAASWPGWVLGTALGAILGSSDILPESVLGALGVALYGMFIAIIVPPTKKNKVLLGIVAISMLLSFVFNVIFSVTPCLSDVPTGVIIIVLTLVIAGAAAYFFPVKEDAHDE